jgi:hypothetical protein
MTTTYTTTLSSTFTRTHAKYLASKIASDLLQMQRFYGKPSYAEIEDYIEEVIILLLEGYLASVDYGFRRDGEWVIALSYSARYGGTIQTDDRSGRVLPGIDIDGASWGSCLRKNFAFWLLSSEEQQQIEDSLPVKRTTAAEPQASNGVWVIDKSYSRNGVGIERRTFREY